MNNQTKAGDSVLVHMSVLLDDGSIADSTVAMGKPALIQLGDDSLSFAFEQKILGLTEGDKTKFRLAAIDAFGESNPDLIQFMDIHKFPNEIELKEEVIVSFTQPNGAPMPGIIRAIEGSSVKVDFNHPIAGQSVTFQIEILSINPEKRTESVVDSFMDGDSIDGASIGGSSVGDIPLTVNGE